MKTQWLDDRLRINLAAFHMDYRVYSVPELFSGLAPTAYGAPREIGVGMKAAF